MNDFKVLISKNQLHARLESLAAEINGAFPQTQEPLVVIGVLTGAFIFMADLVRLLKRPVEIDFVQLSSYGSGQISSGDIQWLKKPKLSLKGRHVLLVEDIIDTGHTVKALRQWAQTTGALDFKVAALLDKPCRRQVEAKGDFIGFEIEDHFVLGYGLDLDGRHREIDEIVYLQAPESLR